MIFSLIYSGKLQNTSLLKESKPKQIPSLPLDIYKIDEEDSDVEAFSKKSIIFDGKLFSER